MTVRDTSIEAFRAIKENGLLSKRRMEVYEYVFDNGPCTARDCAAHLSAKTMAKPDSFQPRFNELKRLGVFKVVGDKVCEHTGMRQMVWDVTSKVPDKLYKDNLSFLLAEMNLETLDEYYLTEHWANRKASYYSSHPKQCFISGSTDNVDLHHITYDRLGAELDEDLVPLHKFWHEFVHRFMKKHKVSLETAHVAVKEVYLVTKEICAADFIFGI